MKILKYILLIIVLLLILFIGKGLLTPSVIYENEIVVNKPVAEAWAVMSDEASTAQWIKGIKKMEHVSGTPNTVGAVSKIYIEEGGEEMVMEETITDLKINERLAMSFTMDFMNMDYELSMEEKDGNTRIKTKSTSIGNGMIAKSIVSFMPGSMKAQEDENLNNLKKLIEENTKNYFPDPVIDSIEQTMN